MKIKWTGSCICLSSECHIIGSATGKAQTDKNSVARMVVYKLMTVSGTYILQTSFYSNFNKNVKPHSQRQQKKATTKINWQTGASSLARSSTAISSDDLFARFRSPSTFWGLAAFDEPVAAFAFFGPRVALTASRQCVQCPSLCSDLLLADRTYGGAYSMICRRLSVVCNVMRCG